MSPEGIKRLQKMLRKADEKVEMLSIALLAMLENRPSTDGEVIEALLSSNLTADNLAEITVMLCAHLTPEEKAVLSQAIGMRLVEDEEDAASEDNVLEMGGVDDGTGTIHHAPAVCDDRPGETRTPCSGSNHRIGDGHEAPGECG